MNIERRKISTSKKMETPGFIIYDDVESVTPKPQEPPPPTVPPTPARVVTDAMRAANSRFESSTHVLEPVFQNGHMTGEWRVYIFRRKRQNDYMLPLKINWDRQFESREAADEWVKLALKYIENGKL